MKVRPYILGSGRTGQAVARALDILKRLDPQLEIEPAVFLKREAWQSEQLAQDAINILAVCNPSALHAQTLVDAAKKFQALVTEKPVAVSLQQVDLIEKISVPVAVFHIYRQLWGPQTIRKMIEAGDLGTVFSIEGKLWQSGAAWRASSPTNEDSWRNSIELSGPHDCLLDLGTHWVDMVSFFLGERVQKIESDLYFVNAERKHRDTHAHLKMQYPGGAVARASLSKTVHGATSEITATVLGSKRSVTWSFLNPDEIVIGEDRDRRILTNKTANRGARQTPFHGLGWLEGYVEVLRQLISQLQGLKYEKYSELSEALGSTRALLKSVQP